MNLSKKHDVLNLLSSKQELDVDPFSMGYSHADENTRKQLDLTCVRFCFNVSITQNVNDTWQSLPPVYSQVIYHNKNRQELTIRDISDAISSSAGGEKKILICDKLNPTGLQLVFHDEESGWSGFGEFCPADIHHKSCVVFRTPAFAGLVEVTTVKLELSKRDGSATSNPIEFTYYPQMKMEGYKEQQQDRPSTIVTNKSISRTHSLPETLTSNILNVPIQTTYSYTSPQDTIELTFSKF